MSLFLCNLWPYLAGGLIGWLLAGWLARRLQHSDNSTEKVVDNPDHLARISRLEAENSRIPSLMSKLSLFESQNPEGAKVQGAAAKEKIVVVDNPELLSEIKSLKSKLRAYESSQTTSTSDTSESNKDSSNTTSLKGSTPAEKKSSDNTENDQASDIDPAVAAGFKLKQKDGKDNFTIIEGIGHKSSKLIHDAGINTFEELSNTLVDDIQKILDAAGSNFAQTKPGTWPAQADMAADKRWADLKKWQDELDGGKE